MWHQRTLAYLLLRVTMGVVFLLAGVTKIIGGVGDFASGMVERFEDTLLPIVLVEIYAWVLPFVEVVIGSLLLLGLFFPLTVVLAGVLMLSLLLGTAVESDPPAIARNTMYLLVVFLLLWLSEFNGYSLDSLRQRDRAS